MSDREAEIPDDQVRLEEALARLEASPAAREWMSPTFLSSYVAVKRKEIAMMAGKTPEEIAERTAEYEARFANPFVAASKGFVDEVIMPHSTRRRIALGLRKLRNKALENPWKKHDNIPL